MFSGVLLLFVLIAILAGALRLLMHVRRSSLVREPICANCHYIIHGPPSGICPECGQPLSPETVLQPHDRLPIPFAARLLTWCAFVSLLAILLIGPWGRSARRLLDPILPITHHRTSHYVLRDQSGLPINFSLIGSGQRPVPAPEQMIVWRDVEQDGLVVDLRPFSAQVRSNGQLGPDFPLSAERLMDYLVRHNLPATSAHVGALLALAQAAREDRPLTPLLLENTRMQLQETGYSACMTRYDRWFLGGLLGVLGGVGGGLLWRATSARARGIGPRSETAPPAAPRAEATAEYAER